MLIEIEYATWLNTMPWNWWATLTSNWDFNLKGLRKKMTQLKDWLKKLCREIRIFYVLEPHKDKTGYHAHALLFTGESKINEATINRIWQKLAGGGLAYNHTQIKKYDPIKGANFYVCKFINRPGIDWDILIETNG